MDAEEHQAYPQGDLPSLSFTFYSTVPKHVDPQDGQEGADSSKDSEDSVDVLANLVDKLDFDGLQVAGLEINPPIEQTKYDYVDYSVDWSQVGFATVLASERLWQVVAETSYLLQDFGLQEWGECIELDKVMLLISDIA